MGQVEVGQGLERVAGSKPLPRTLMRSAEARSEFAGFAGSADFVRFHGHSGCSSHILHTKMPATCCGRRRSWRRWIFFILFSNVSAQADFAMHEW